MKTIDYRFTLDLYAEGAQVIRNVQRGDTAARLIVTFSEEGKPYPLDSMGDNKVIAFVAAKADKTYFYDDNVEIDDEANAVVITLPQQATAAAGIALCQFKLIDGGQIKASPMFSLNVTSNPYDEQEISPSSTDFLRLTNLIAEIESKLENHEFDGEDGFSPSASVSKVGNTATITITDKTGTTTATVKDGAKGDKGDKGDPGDSSSHITKQVPLITAVGKPDISSPEYAALLKGEMFYTYSSLNNVRLFWLKVSNSAYLRLGVSGSEYLPEVPYTTNNKGEKIPNVSSAEFSALVCGQMFSCETITEASEIWVKTSRESCFPFDRHIGELIVDSIPTNVSAFNNDAGYLTQHQDISGKVDKTRKIAGVDLQDDITPAELKTALSVPTKTSDLTNDSGFITQHQDISGKEDSANKVEVIQSSTSKSQYPSVNAMTAYVTNAISIKENAANKVTSLSSGSTNTQYPSAKAVYDQLALKANSEDIPEYLRDLTDGDKAIVKYEASSPPPTSETSDSYAVPCLWEYSGDLWYVYKDAGTGGRHLYSSILLTQVIPTNVSAFINDAGYLTAQGITSKMDLAQIRASIDDDTQVKQGQFLVVGGNVWLKTGAYGAAGHLVLEDQANKVSAIAASPTNTQYPSALAVKNYVDTAVEGDNVVPSYWEADLEIAENKVRAIQRQHGADCINLVWFSDFHGQASVKNDFRYNHQRNVPLLSGRLCRDLNIPLILCTGDTAANSVEPTEATMRADFDYFSDLTKKAEISDRLINCYGNHDGAWGDNRSGDSGYIAAYAWHIPPRDYWNDIIRSQCQGADRHYSADGTYGYIDLSAQKLRIVQLNSFWVGDNDTYYENGTMVYDYMHHGGYGQDQLDWLVSKALKFNEDGWSVLFMAHMPPTAIDGSNYIDLDKNRDASILNGILTAYANQSSYTGSYTYDSSRDEGEWANVSVNVDFSNESFHATPVAFLSGHCHKSREITSVLPFPIITITCAENSSYDSATEGERTNESSTETALDILSICKDDCKIRLTRLGIGSDREVSYAQIEPTPINQIPISTDANGNIYEGVGYKDGYRFNSSHAETSASGYFVTGFIPVENGSVLNFEGFQFATASVDGINNGYCRIETYDENKATINGAAGNAFVSYSECSPVIVNDRLKQLTVNSSRAMFTGVAYIRVSGYGTGDNAAIYVS